MDVWPKLSSDSGNCPPSSIHAASPFDVTIGILRSPLEVLMTVARLRKNTSSSSASTSFFSYSSGTRYPPSESVPIERAFCTSYDILFLILFQNAFLYSSVALPVFVSPSVFAFGWLVIGVLVAFASSASMAACLSSLSISFPRFTTSASILS